MKVGTGISTHRDILSCVREAATQARGKIGKSRIDLAIVFSSSDLASPALLKAISEKVGDISIIGCTGLSVISNSGVHQHALALALISSEGDLHISTSYIRDVSAKTAFTAGKELAEKLISEPKSSRREVGIFFNDGRITDIYKLILGLQENLGIIFPMGGACASDALLFRKTNVYFDRLVLSDAAAGVLLGGKFSYGWGLRHGFNPIGKHRVITRGYDNIIETIDNKPAVSVYEEFFAKSFPELKMELPSISRVYPLGVYLSEAKEYLIRNILTVEENGALVCQGDIINGGTLRMMIGTKERFIEAAGQAAEDAKQNLTIAKFGSYEQAPSVDIVFVFSSAFRHKYLKRSVAEEVEMIKKSVGEHTPIIGVSTYGEYAPLAAASTKGRALFQNQSIAVLLIGS